MFQEKQWTLGRLNHIIHKTDVRCKFGSGRPRWARTDVVIDQIDNLVLSQEDKPQSHSSQRQIARQFGISLTSVDRTIKNNLQLKCHKTHRAHHITDGNKKKHAECCWKLLKWYSVKTGNFIGFTDQKLFTVAAPTNTQNYCIYAPVGVRKKNTVSNHSWRCWPTFSRSLIVDGFCWCVSTGANYLHFIDAGVIYNGHYCPKFSSCKNSCPTSKKLSDYFTFKQNGATAHCAKETVDLLEREKPDLISPSLWPQNNPDLNPVDDKTL